MSLDDLASLDTNTQALSGPLSGTDATGAIDRRQLQVLTYGANERVAEAYAAQYDSSHTGVEAVVIFTNSEYYVFASTIATTATATSTSATTTAYTTTTSTQTSAATSTSATTTASTTTTGTQASATATATAAAIACGTGDSLINWILCSLERIHPENPLVGNANLPNVVAGTGFDRLPVL